MRIVGVVFAVLALSAGARVARAADRDFNGRWDIVVHQPPAQILSTTTKAWWLEVTGAGTGQISLKCNNTRIDYEVKYVAGKLEGSMSGTKKSLTFTGHRAPRIDDRDDGSWVRAKPVVLFNGKDLSGWTGVNSEKAE